MTEKKTHRLFLLIATIVLFLFFGLIYAWSLFIEPLEAEFGWQRSQTSLIFTISCVTVCVGMVISGLLEKRLSHRIVLLIAAALITIGFLASSRCHTLMEIFVFYGVMVGTGVGIGYNCGINTTLKWFPDKQGAASGAMLMGYGGGAMVLSPFVTMMLEAMDWRTTFFILAIVFGAVVVTGSFILRVPSKEAVAPLLAKAKEANTVSEYDYTTKQMLKTPVFWIAFAWLVLCTSGGLGLISQAVPAALEAMGSNGADAAAIATATAAMGSVSLSNGFGRLINGFVWDRVGYRVSLTWISIAFSAGMLLCAVGLGNGNFIMVVVGFVLLGFMFGGTMSVTSAIVGSFFGMKHYGINYAIMCCQMIPAAIIGPTLLATMQTASGSYLSAFWAFLIIALITFVMSFMIKTPQRPSKEGKKGKALETAVQHS